MKNKDAEETGAGAEKEPAGENTEIDSREPKESLSNLEAPLGEEHEGRHRSYIRTYPTETAARRTTGSGALLILKWTPEDSARLCTARLLRETEKGLQTSEADQRSKGDYKCMSTCSSGPKNAVEDSR
ncbi:hypothetical protein NDU88_004774 [Pleurodeles waltl]|uniref:Uncharacterized protein n=1 Tax=Pleurodeles waltl TaxID=8319 RepID=A0AAV7TSY1_PLEWA|nr:hypothetical protein NDU88_004774 [Pleurodeles waltl]